MSDQRLVESSDQSRKPNYEITNNQMNHFENDNILRISSNPMQLTSIYSN